MTEVLELDTMPSAAGLYARALAPLPRPEIGGGLPDRVVRLAGHRCTVADVAGYAAVCGFGLADALPPTWLHVLTFPLQLRLMTASDFPLGLAGMVHLGNTMTQHRPARITETLELSVRAEGPRPHRRGVLVDLVGEVRTAGELVWQGRSSYLNRQQHLPGAPSTIPEADRGQPSPLDGASPTAALWRLPAGLGRAYAAVSGDVNPIHLNPVAARAFGFPRTIVHGMWSHARMLAALQPRLPDAYEVSVRFTKPVLLPSSVRFAAARTDDGFTAQLTNRVADRLHVDLTLTRR